MDLLLGWRAPNAGAPSLRLGVINLINQRSPVVADSLGLLYSPYGDPRGRRLELTVSTAF